MASELLRQTVAWIGCFAIVAQPLMAQTANITGDGGRQSPIVHTAANGVTVVDIKTPNGAGVSHNTYGNFSVGAGGAILNNSATEISQSQLGGLLQGNANLNRLGPAGVILNEITSTNLSLLEGAIEVHGTSAEVVVANPNGITCNGCGFINTPRVTLSTGIPKLGADGSLATLRVEKGDVLIGSNGASLGTVDIFDIVSRKISVQGAIAAKKQLNLIAGRNELGWQTGLITPLASDGNEPGIAIDSALLGGMYAGAIKIISNDQGSGVNMRGQMAAHAGQMQITADGRLVMGKARATGDIVVRSKRSTVRATDTLFSEKSVVLEGLTRAEIAAGVLVASRDNVGLSAGEIALEDGAIVSAGITRFGAFGQSGSVTINGNKLSVGTGRIVADTDVTVTAGNIDLARASAGASSIEARRNARLNTSSVTGTNAQVVAVQGLGITSMGALTLTDGSYSAGGNARINSASALKTSATLEASGLVDALAQTGTLSNSGRIVGDAGLALTAAAGDVSNSGELFSQQDVGVIASGVLGNTATGEIAAGKILLLRGASLNNQGTVIALGSELRTETTGATSNSGTLRSDGVLTLKSDGAVSNIANLLAQGNIALTGLNTATSGAFTTGAGSVLNGSNVTLNTASLSNSGDILAHTGDATVNVTANVMNAGRVLGNEALTLSADGTVTVSSGELSAGEDLVIKGRSGAGSGAITAAGLLNAGKSVNIDASGLTTGPRGQIAAFDGDLNVSLSAGLNNSGTLVSKKSATLSIDGTLQNQGEILVEDGLIIKGLTRTRSGAATTTAGSKVNGGSITADVASLNNGGAIIGHDDDVLIRSLGGISSSVSIETARDLTLQTDSSLSNGGTVLATRNLSVSGLNSTRAGSVTNQAGARLEGGNTLAVTASSLDNAGTLGSHGTSTAATRPRSVEIDLSSTAISSGTVFAKGNAQVLSTTLTNSGKILTDGAFETNGTLSNTSGAELSVKSVTASGGSVSNAGNIRSYNGDVVLDARSSFSNTGVIEARGDSSITLGQSQTLSFGKLTSTGILSLTGANGASFGNLTIGSGYVLNGAGGLTLSVGNLLNDGGTGSSGGAVDIKATGSITNRGLLYSGTSSHYRLNGGFSHSGADVLAGSDLIIEGLSGMRAGALLNEQGGIIEAVSGNMILRVASLTNSRTAPVISQTSNNVVTTEGNPDETPYIGTTNTLTTLTTTTTTDQATLNGAGAKILAGGNIKIESGSTKNQYSQIAAGGNISISGGSTQNIAQDLIERTDVKRANRHVRGQCNATILDSCIDKTYDWWNTNSESTSSATVGAVYGTIEAGGNLSISAPTGYVANTALRNNAGQVGTSSGGKNVGSASVSGASGTSGYTLTSLSTGSPVSSLSGASVTVTGVPQDAAGLGLSALVTGANSILGRSALLEAQLSPNMPYLVETRSDFIDRSKYLGSDYFIKRLDGYDSNKAQKRFGDAYVETRLIRDQIYELTGSRFVGGAADMRGQMQSLYDSAIDESKRLGLSVGTSLSPGQIAALKNDITWLETQTVRGQKVLVPRVYLSRATLANLDMNSSQLRSGGSTTITTAVLTNTGSVAGQGGLNLTTTSSLNNQGGSLFSDVDITINAGSLFNNNSGQVSGGNVEIAAAKITSDTLTSRDLFSGGFADRMQSRSGISATRSLTLSAGGGGLSAVGADLSAGKELTIRSDGDVNLTALQLDFSRSSATNGGSATASSTTNTLSNLSSGTSMTVRSEGELAFVGVTAKSGGDLSVSAEEKVTILGVQDTKTESLSLSRRSGLFGGRSSMSRSSASVSTQETTLQSGGALTVKSDGDIIAGGANLTAKSDATIASGNGDVVLGVMADSNSSSLSERKSGLFSSGRSSQSSNSVTNQGVRVKSGGDLEIAGTHVTAIGSTLDASGSATIKGEDNLVFGVAEDSESSSQSKKFTSFLGINQITTADAETSTNAVGTQLTTGKAITIETGGDTGLVGATVDAGTELTVNVGGDLAIAAARDTYTNETSAKEKSLLKGGGDGFLSFYGSEKNTLTTRSTRVNGSKVTASGNITITTGGDMNVSGSELAAKKNASIDVSGTLAVAGAADTYENNAQEERKGRGISFAASGGGISVFAGARKTNSEAGEFGESVFGSQIIAGDDLTIKADKDVIQAGSDFASGTVRREDGLLVASEGGGDLKVTAGRDILSSEQVSSKRLNQFDEEIRIGVTANVSSSTLSGLQQINQATKTATSGYGGLEAIGAASGVIQGVGGARAVAGNINNTFGNGAKGPRQYAKFVHPLTREETTSGLSTGGANAASILGIDATVSIGASKTQSASEQNNTSAVVSRLTANGGSIELNSGRDAKLQGTQVNANKDVSVIARRDLSITSSQNTYKTDRSNNSSSVSVGLSVLSGTPTASASANSGNQSVTGTTQTNANVFAGDKVTLKAGRDITVARAQVGGDELDVNAKRNLTVASRQDNETTTGASQGASVSLRGGSVTKGNISGTNAWVNEQTRLTATGKINVEVGAHTQIDGSVIASGTDDLKLTTGTIGFSDIIDTKKSSAVTATLGLGLGGIRAEGNVAHVDRQQINRATVGRGKITVTDTEAQAKLQANDAEGATSYDVARLNRDVDKAQEITKDDRSGTQFYFDSEDATELVRGFPTVREAWENIDSQLALLGNQQLAAALKDPDGIDFADAIRKLQDCTNNQLGSLGSPWNPFNWFVSPAYAAECSITLRNGKSISISDERSCKKILSIGALSIVWSIILRSDAHRSFGKGMLAGAEQYGEDVAAIISDPKKFTSEVLTALQTIWENPVLAGSQMADQLLRQYADVLTGLDADNYEAAGALLAKIGIDIVVGLLSAGAGVAAFKGSKYLAQLAKNPVVQARARGFVPGESGSAPGGQKPDTNRTVPRVDTSDLISGTPPSRRGAGQYRLGEFDNHAGHGLEARVTRSGELSFSVSANGSRNAELGSGADMFNSLMKRLDADGVQVNAVRSEWVPGVGSTNHTQYVNGINNGLTPTQAAANTWTGQRAVEHGFTNIIPNSVDVIISFSFGRP